MTLPFNAVNRDTDNVVAMVENNAIGKFELVLVRDGAEDHQYEPGERLRGEVVLVIAGIAPLRADSIWVELRGEAQVSWQQTDDEDRNQTPQQHHRDDDGDHRIDFRRHQHRATGQRLRLGAGAGIVAAAEQQPASRGIRSSSTSYTLPHSHQNGCRSLCTAVETYVDEKRTVWTAAAESTPAGVEADPRPSAQASADGAIAPGEYRFPFEFQLPSDLPSSFRGQYGSVGYALRAVVMMSPTSVGRHRLAGGRAAVVSEPFFIKRRLKRQLLPPPSSPSTDAVDRVAARQRKPADGVVRHRRERQSLTSDDCSTTASSDVEDTDDQMLITGSSVAVVEVLERRSSSSSTPRLLLGPCCFGAVDMRRIRAEFAVVNGTECRLGGDFRVDIRVSDANGKFRRRLSASESDPISVEASLVQICTFIASHGRRRRTVALVSRRIDSGGSNARDRSLTRRWADLRLSVPTNLPESGLPGCNIIDVSYELRFSVEVYNNSKLCKIMHYRVQ